MPEPEQPPAAPSPFWADETIWKSQTTVHSFAMDKQGRVWAAARIRKALDDAIASNPVPVTIGDLVAERV